MTILIVNSNAMEAEDWRIQLENKGYQIVETCLELSTMVYLLTKERVDVVICAANVIKDEPNVVLESSREFFPRTKFVLIGNFPAGAMTKKLSGLSVKKTFDTNLDKYYKSPLGTRRAEMYSTQQATVLLTDHFIPAEEAAQILARTVPALKPGYVVIYVTADIDFVHINHLLKSLTPKLNIPIMFQMYPGRHYFILGGSPTLEQCLSIGRALRLALLEETDAMFSIGISRMRKSAAELNACRKEAERASAAVHSFGQNSVIHIDYLDSDDFEYVYPWHKQNRLVEEAVDGNGIGAARLVDEIFAVLKAHPKCTPNLVSKVVLGIIVQLNIAGASRVASFDKVQGDTLSIKKLMQNRTVDEINTYLKEGILEFAKEMDTITDLKREALYMRMSLMKDDANTEFDIGQDLEMTLNTTLNFANDAVFRNGGTDIYTFFKKQEEDDDDDDDD